MTTFFNQTHRVAIAGLLLAAGPAFGQFNPGSYYRITSQISGKCLDIYGASSENGTNAVQWENNGGDNQQWQILDGGGGYYKLVARHSGQCLDVYGESQRNGAQVAQWPDNGQDNQRWHLDALPNGGYTLTAKHSGLVLQLAGNSLADGALVQQGIPQSCAAGAVQAVGAGQPISVTQSASTAGIGTTVPGVSATPALSAKATGRLTAYPNPANDFVTVLLPSGARPADAVALYDALGRLVPHQPLDGDGRLAVSQLPAGTYALAVNQGGAQLRQRILVAHDGSVPASAGQAWASAGTQPAKAVATNAVIAGACAQGWAIEEVGAPMQIAPPIIVAATPDADAYRQLAQNYSLASGMTYRYGAPNTVGNNGLPNQYMPGDKRFNNHGNGTGWEYQLGDQDPSKNDFSSNMAQILHVADKSNNAGVDIIQQLVMGEGTYSEKPQLPWVYYGGGAPDPDVQGYAAANGGPLRQPTAIGRSYGFVGWASNDLVAFQSGLIAAFGTNTSRGQVSVKLPANKVPTAVAVTDNNEFALVTVWDTDALKGQVAVLALGTGNSFWGDWAAVYPGLRNRGWLTFMKLLGYVDLPGVTQPTEISASTDFAASLDAWQGWMFSPDGRNGRYQEEQLTLSNETNRQSFVNGSNQNRYSKGGFAVITSKAEKKVVFLDLKPLFDQVRTMYFTSRSNFDQTQNLGQQPGQWPYAFSVTPAAAPVVVKTVDMAQPPTAVRTSLLPGVNQAYVATLDGTLHLFNVGAYGTTNGGGTPASIAEVGSVDVGSNPTSIAYVKDKGWGKPNTLGNQLLVAVRGERAVKWVQLAGNTGSVFKTLRDKRLQDPVWVEDNDTHGTEAAVVTVADYSGKQVLNYRYSPIIFHTNGGATLGMGPGGNDEFECGGFYSVAGFPFQVSGTNVP